MWMIGSASISASADSGNPPQMKRIDVLEDQQQAEGDQKLIFLGAPVERAQQQRLDHEPDQRDHAGAHR